MRGPRNLPSNRRIGVRFLLVNLLIGMLNACAVVPEPLTDDDLIRISQRDRVALFKDNEPLSGELTLAQAIARSLKHNLDHRLKIMEEALALGQLSIDKYELLPKLISNAGYSDRSDANASSSVDYVTKASSDSNPSYSADRSAKTGDLTISWNILDFGISYYTAKQDADRALIAAERRRKAVHNLIQEVRFAYWRTVSAQALQNTVNATIQIAENALKDAETVVREGLKKPLEVLRYKKTLLENIRQLESISQELATAHIELASLINVAPGTEIKVSQPPTGLEGPTINLSLTEMETLAFHNNPEIREQSYHSRIAIKETRKAILSLLPGITLSGGRHFDGNDLLEANRWFEWSSKLTWNVLNLFSAKKRIEQAKTGEKVAAAQQLALRMAILAQVHVAERQFLNAVKQFERADQLSNVDAWIAKLMAQRQEADAQSVLDRVSDETGAITSKLKRYQAYAQLEAAFGRLHATIGTDSIPKNISSFDLKTITSTLQTSFNAMRKGELAKRRLQDLQMSRRNQQNTEKLSTVSNSNFSSIFYNLNFDIANIWEKLIYSSRAPLRPANSAIVNKPQSVIKSSMIPQTSKLPLKINAKTKKTSSIIDNRNNKTANKNNEPAILWLLNDALNLISQPFIRTRQIPKPSTVWTPLIIKSSDTVTRWAIDESNWTEYQLRLGHSESHNTPDLAVVDP